MPWCEQCDRFYNPNSMAPDGTCMKCGSFIASPNDEPEEAESAEKSKAPWHFKLILALIIIYLTFRLIQLIIWLIHRL